MSAERVDLVRHEWEEAYRRLEGQRTDAMRYARLVEQVDLVVDGLRRRLGQTFTLAELERAYRDGDVWARETIAEQAPYPGWPRDLSLVLAAACRVYERGAVDYGP